MNVKIKKIPFALSRSESVSLTEQMASGFRNAILGGYYRPGDHLPTLQVMSNELGVSMIVSRFAIQRLAEEGLVDPRRGRGIEVVGKGVGRWKGRVLFIVAGRNDEYHVNVVADVLRNLLLKDGYMFNQITVPRDEDGKFHLEQLQAQLRDPVSMTVEMFAVPEINRVVFNVCNKSVVVANDNEQYHGDVVRFVSTAAVGDFVQNCVRSGVKSVLQLGFCSGFADAKAELEKAGIAVRSELVKCDNRDTGVIAQVKRGTLNFFDKFLESGEPLPDLIYFTDDHMAEAGLLSLALHGIEVPKAVKVVAWSNRGLAPVYSRRVSRMEVDPYENGVRLHDFILRKLEGKDVAAVPELDPVYVHADTFR